MANNLVNPLEISPSARDTDADGTPDSNVLTVTMSDTKGTDWVSQWFPVQGVEHGTEQLSLMFYVDWNGATSIQILAQFQHIFDAKPLDENGILRGEEALPITIFDGARLDSSFQLVQDLIELLAANFRTDPGTMEVPLEVAAVGQVRFLAKAVTGAGLPTMQMQVLAGGGWRGA